MESSLSLRLEATMVMWWIYLMNRVLLDIYTVTEEDDLLDS